MIRCIRCNRPLTKNVLIAGYPVGETCAKKMGLTYSKSNMIKIDESKKEYENTLQLLLF